MHLHCPGARSCCQAWWSPLGCLATGIAMAGRGHSSSEETMPVRAGPPLQWGACLHPPAVSVSLGGGDAFWDRRGGAKAGKGRAARGQSRHGRCCWRQDWAIASPVPATVCSPPILSVSVCVSLISVGRKCPGSHCHWEVTGKRTETCFPWRNPGDQQDGALPRPLAQGLEHSQASPSPPPRLGLPELHYLHRNATLS